MNFIDVVKVEISAVLGIVITMLGGFDAMLKLLIIMIMIDMLSGALHAVKKHRFRLQIALWGIWVKICEMLTVAICNGVDQVVGTQPWLRNIAIIWYIICESASVLEHMARLGVPMPKGLLGVLKQAKQGFGISITKIAKKILQEYANKVMATPKEKKDTEEKK